MSRQSLDATPWVRGLLPEGAQLAEFFGELESVAEDCPHDAVATLVTEWLSAAT